MIRKLRMIFLFLCLSACTAGYCAGIDAVCAYADVQGVFEYEVNDKEKGTVSITWYTGTDPVVEIPEQINGHSVTFIVNDAFRDCSSVESIKIPAGITGIGVRAFGSCSRLKQIEVAPGNEEYYSKDGILYERGIDGPELIFCPIGKTGAVEILETASQIGSMAFDSCSSIESIKIPAGITWIEEGAFRGCSRLTEISAAKENAAYRSEDGILYTKDGTKLICCPGGKTGGIKIPESVNEIAESAFYGCGSIERIEIPADVTEIGGWAFVLCSRLTEISVSAGNTAYKSEDGILYTKDGTELISCPGGKTGRIKIPESVNEIGSSAFYGCGSIESVNLPAGVTELPPGVFARCSRLTEISADAGNAAYQSKDGILYTKDGTGLAAYPAGKAENVKIPSGIKTIVMGAFEGNTVVKSVEIPAGVKVIEYRAFYGCSSLQSVALPEGLTDIYSTAFSGCTSLTKVKIPEGITVIAGGVFGSCKNLAEIYLPASVKEIEAGTLGGLWKCKLKDIYYAGSKSQWETVEFDYSLAWNTDFLKITVHFAADDPDTPQQPSEPSKPDTPQQPSEPSGPGVQEETVTVLFDAQGGLKTADIKIRKNGKLAYIPVTSKNGYVFQGWYTDVNGRGSFLTLNTVISQNITYYAYWTAVDRSMTGITVSVSGTPYAGIRTSSILSVRILYSDGTAEQIFDYSVSKPVLDAGTNDITVSFQGFTQKMRITANEQGTDASLKGLSAVYTGGALPAGVYGAFAGLTVRAEYADGTSREITDYVLSTNKIVKGSNQITVSYGGKTAHFYVNGFEYAVIHMGNIPGLPDIWVMDETDLASALKNFIPTKSGYYFNGWYLDEACTKKMPAGTGAGKEMRIYAKWEKVYAWRLNKTKASVKKGKKLKLEVKGLSSSKVTWKTSNSRIASVSKSGVVKAKRKGTVYITAVTKDGSVMTCVVKVKK